VAHTGSCSNAKTRYCRCGGCAGSLHGWKGALALSYPAMAPARESKRTASEHEWAGASRAVPETRLTQRKAAAAVDQVLSPGNRANKRSELAESHLLCSVLAALACIMQGISDDRDKLTREIATRIVTYFIGRKRINLPPLIVKVAAEATVKAMDKIIQTLAAAQHFDNLQRAARILALMMCPAPEKHEDVVRCCQPAILTVTPRLDPHI
jgi:hypothetical protein